MIAHMVLDFLAQDQNGNVINVTTTTPPGSDKIQKLLGVISWVAFAALIALTAKSGVTFASAYSDGAASPGQKIAPVACGVGAIIVGSAASWITFFA
ncbi:hypothetical protein [Nocardia yamanashiensis]|uniref:hypothetical protein n=1 Tax=Nocardia yamanashiensis TaxID=209247 RepID=UPI0008309C5F|nr:hypothetical protein [Nocardia yamanashiensis]